MTKLLAETRELKRQWLSEHPAILRKVGTGPLDRDRPNALHPDAVVGSKIEPTMFRAPRELCGLTIHTCAGMIAVPAHGVVATHPDHSELHAELAGRGFARLHSINKFGKCADGSDPAAALARDRLQLILPPFCRGHQ